MPGPLLRLQLALTAPTVDVGAISDAIRSDIGLAARFLRIATQELGEVLEQLPRLEELVVHLGLDKIRCVSKGSQSLTHHPKGLVALRSCERTWKRARLTALAAEYLAARTGVIDSNKAYWAGLFHHLGYCLRSLNRLDRDAHLADPHGLSHAIARSWDFPDEILANMWAGKNDNPAPTVRLVRDIVKTAMEWVLDVELQGIADSEYSLSLQCTEMFGASSRKLSDG